MPDDENDPSPPTEERPDVPEAEAGGVEDHDETGLDLARSIARSLAGSKRPARRTPPRPGSRPKRADPKASGAYPDDRDPQTLDSTIGRLIAQQGWGTDVRVHGVFSRWDRLVGREVAQHCRPESFADGKLVVRTDSTAWATQMRLLAPTVVRTLNEELGDGTVTVIDVLGPNVPSWRKGRRSVRDGRGPRDTYG
ncbi:MAG TPA: DciA family protein [Nocardioidaceae bacterium]|nr:DciA family protein [Nocardioidaceae bacterium]